MGTCTCAGKNIILVYNKIFHMHCIIIFNVALCIKKNLA